MQPQDVATATPYRQGSATFAPQPARAPRAAFIFSTKSTSLRLGYSQDTSNPRLGQAGQTCSVNNEKKTRRNRCQRASKQCWPLALSQLLQLAQKSLKKNMLLLSQRRSRLSQHTQANTSNSNWGRPRAASGSHGFGSFDLGFADLRGGGAAC